jgi:hypothetical protein
VVRVGVQNTLDLYLENRHGFMYSNFGDAAASRQLSKARGSDWLFIPASSAIELLVAVDRIECEASDVTALWPARMALTALPKKRRPCKRR